MNSSRRFHQLGATLVAAGLIALLPSCGTPAVSTQTATATEDAHVDGQAITQALAAQASAAAASAAQVAAEKVAAAKAAAARKAAADQAAAQQAAAAKAAADQAAVQRTAAERAPRVPFQRPTRSYTSSAQGNAPQPQPAPAPRRTPVTRQAPPPPAGPVSSWVTLLHPHCTGTPGNYTLTFSIRWSNGHVETPPADTGPSNGVTDLDYDYAGQSHWNAYPVNFGCPS